MTTMTTMTTLNAQEINLEKLAIYETTLDDVMEIIDKELVLSLIHISEPTRPC